MYYIDLAWAFKNNQDLSIRFYIEVCSCSFISKTCVYLLIYFQTHFRLALRDADSNLLFKMKQRKKSVQQGWNSDNIAIWLLIGGNQSYSESSMASIKTIVFRQLELCVSWENRWDSLRRYGLPFMVDWLYSVLRHDQEYFNYMNWRRHHYRWRAAKFRPMLGAQGLWAGRSCHTCCDMEPWFIWSHPKERPIQSPFTTHKGIWRVYSNRDPIVLSWMMQVHM